MLEQGSAAPGVRSPRAGWGSDPRAAADGTSPRHVCGANESPLFVQRRYAAVADPEHRDWAVGLRLHFNIMPMTLHR